jgi:hypothetical protein
MTDTWTRNRAKCAAVLGGAALLLASLTASPCDAATPPESDAPRSLAELLTAIDTTWRNRDIEGYLRLWPQGQPLRVAEERRLVAESFASEQCTQRLGHVRPDPEDAATMVLYARTFCVREPCGVLRQARYSLRSSATGWEIASREGLGQAERFVHLDLSPEGFRADGRTLRFEDFELHMERGTLFVPPALIGPTALVFVGKGTVHFSPRPATEQEQLRQFCGRRELVERVKVASVRCNPDDLDKILGPAALERDPDSAKRWRAARQALDQYGADAYRLDANLPGSPWWTFPLHGKATVVFRARGATLAYGLATQPEDVTLFDRSRGRCICMYPGSRGSTRYYEDLANSVDVLHHDLRLRLDPARLGFEGEDTLRLRLRTDASSIYLRLDGNLAVRSVTSQRWGSLLFFRAARHNLLVVTLGASPHRGDELPLTVSYAGRLAPARGDRLAPEAALGEVQAERDVDARAPRVYSSEPLWYPQTLFSDYATSSVTVDLPEGYEAVSGGERVTERVEDGRRVVGYRQVTPGRYLGLVVGRLREAGRVVEGGVALRGFGMFSTSDEVPDLLQQSARILRFFETLFGACPYPHINVVFVEGLTPGGYSPPGMTILSRRALHLRRLAGDDPGDFSDVPGFFLAHELAHQWWGHGVAPANYHERWLSEAQAQYAAALWVRHAQGDKAFRQVLDRMIDWARRESDQGPIALGQRLGHVQGAPRIYRAVVYNKGALVLHMLRGVLGDDAFFKGLKQFQEHHRFHTVTTDDLGQAWTAVSGRDLRPYLDRWIGETELPVLHWSRQMAPSGGSWRTTVKVVAQNLPGPVPLEIAVGLRDETERTRVILPPSGGTYVIETQQRPRRVRLNDDRGLLARVERKRQ